MGFAGPVGPVETPQGQGEAKKEGGAGQVMFPRWRDQPPHLPSICANAYVVMAFFTYEFNVHVPIALYIQYIHTCTW